MQKIEMVLLDENVCITKTTSVFIKTFFYEEEKDEAVDRQAIERDHHHNKNKTKEVGVSVG